MLVECMQESWFVVLIVIAVFNHDNIKHGFSWIRENF